MQTSQVTNAANVLTTTSAPNKQPDANASAEPFGKVLSREVSQRNGANDAPRNKEASSASAQQPAKTANKTSESKSTKESKPADKALPDDESTDAESALPDEMLALVANLAEMNAPAEQAADTQALQPAEAVSDAQAAAAAASVVAFQAATQTSDQTAQLAMASPTAGVQAESSTLPTAGIIGKSDGTAAQLKQAEVAGKAELPVESLNTAVKIDELNAQAATQAASPKAQDFTAAMTESLNGVTGNMQPVQQAALHALQQQAPNTAEKLTPRVGTPAWDQALGQKVVWMVAGEQQSASLTLNPPDLGPLQVVLNVSNSQANATFIAAQPEVRQALEAALPKLRDMLGEAGIQLGQASVNSGSPNQQGSFDQQASQASRGHSQFGNRDTAGTDAQVRVSRVQPASSGSGLVDTFV